MFDLAFYKKFRLTNPLFEESESNNFVVNKKSFQDKFNFLKKFLKSKVKNFRKNFKFYNFVRPSTISWFFYKNIGLFRKSFFLAFSKTIKVKLSSLFKKIPSIDFKQIKELNKVVFNNYSQYWVKKARRVERDFLNLKKTYQKNLKTYSDFLFITANFWKKDKFLGFNSREDFLQSKKPVVSRSSRIVNLEILISLVKKLNYEKIYKFLLKSFSLLHISKSLIEKKFIGFLFFIINCGGFYFHIEE